MSLLVFVRMPLVLYKATVVFLKSNKLLLSCKLQIQIQLFVS